MTQDQAIAEITRRLVDYYHPERIYLFGTAARGDGGPDSDVDSCVALPDETARGGFFLCVRCARGGARPGSLPAGWASRSMGSGDGCGRSPIVRKRLRYARRPREGIDRKSTRLNSSHLV